MPNLTPIARARAFLAALAPSLEATVRASLRLKSCRLFAAIARLRAHSLPKAKGFGKFHGDRE